jgi:hypothetical protein
MNQKNEQIKKYLQNLIGVEKVTYRGDVFTIVSQAHYEEKDYVDVCYLNLGLNLTPKKIIVKNK